MRSGLSPSPGSKKTSAYCQPVIQESQTDVRSAPLVEAKSIPLEARSRPVIEARSKPVTPPCKAIDQWEFDTKDEETLRRHTQAFRETTKKGVKQIRDEWKTSKGFIPEGSKDAFVANEPRNRYKDILLLDATRIKLAGIGPSSKSNTDYIHASRVTVGSNQFICAQAPMATTVAHFWAMVKQENVKLIVMLCRPLEDGKEKSVEYFPRSNGAPRKTFGAFSIACSSRRENLLAGVHHSVLELTHKPKDGNEKPSTVTVEHLYYDAWPDHSVPDNFDVSLSLIKMSREKRKGGPVLVHCSAGVGRTGCFVAVEMARQMCVTSEVFSMDSLLKNIRRQRMHAVQNDVQFMYVCRAVAESLIQRKVMKRSELAKFVSEYEELVKRKKIKVAAHSKKTMSAEDVEAK